MACGWEAQLQPVFLLLRKVLKVYDKEYDPHPQLVKAGGERGEVL